MSGNNCTQYFNSPAWNFGENVFGPCSGNGQCINNRCVCNPGWTGLSDWINADGFDCQINIAAYKVTWGLLMFIQVVCIYVSIPYLKARYESYMKIKAHKQAKGESYSLRENTGALSMVVWYGCGAPCLLLICIVKLAMDGERIGVTPLVTVLFIAMKSIFYLCYALFQPSLLSAVVHGLKKAKSYVVYNRHLTYGFFGIQVLAAMLAIIALTDETRQEAAYLAYLGFMLLTAGFVSSQAFYIKKKLSKTLDRSYELGKQEKTLVMKKKLRKMQNTPLKQGGFLTIIYLVQLVWPFLWTKHDYIVALTWIIFPMTGLRTAQTSLTEAESEKISRNSSSAGVGMASPGWDEKDSFANTTDTVSSTV